MTETPIPSASSVKFSDTTASVLLDAIRGIAALLVLLGHWRNAFFVDFAQIHSHRILIGIAYLLCGAGHQAVVIFFVLSGYLISGSIIRNLQRGNWSWIRYLTHRLVRLWVVLLPALGLGAMWDRLGIRFGYAPALYSGALYNHMTPDVSHALSFWDLIGNAAFVQTILVPTYGSNGALWSLANEFWYYLIFPLGMCIFLRSTDHKKFVQTLICVTLLILIALFLTKDIWLLFPVWLLGTLLCVIPRRPTVLWQRVVASIAYAILFFGIAMLDHTGWFGAGAMSDWILGVGTFGFIWALLGATGPAGKAPASVLARSAASFSYTLYVAHTPILIFLVALMARDKRWLPTTTSGAMAVCALAIILLYAWLLAKATELRTDKLRGWVERKISAVQDDGT